MILRKYFWCINFTKNPQYIIIIITEISDMSILYRHCTYWDDNTIRRKPSKYKSPIISGFSPDVIAEQIKQYTNGEQSVILMYSYNIYISNFVTLF